MTGPRFLPLDSAEVCDELLRTLSPPQRFPLGIPIKISIQYQGNRLLTVHALET